MALTYKIHHLPTADHSLLCFLAGKVASLRLQALLVSPASFTNTFEIETKTTAQEWVTRLQLPHVHTFIAVAYPADTSAEFQTIDRGNFVGSATLLGPIPKFSYHLPLSNGPTIGEDSEENKWQITGLFNSPEHRKKGLAKMLIQSAIDFTLEQEAAKKSRVRIGIGPLNHAVKGLYGSMGFVPAGTCTLVEGMTANGDGHLVPKDGGVSDPLKYLTRHGLLMERVTER